MATEAFGMNAAAEMTDTLCPDISEGWLRVVIDQFAASRGAPLLHDLAPAAIDEFMADISAAGQAVISRLWADVASIARHGPERTARSLEHMEFTLTGATSAERRLLAVLAYRETERGEDSEHAARLALHALNGGQLAGDEARSPDALAMAVVLGLAGRSHDAEEVIGTILERAQHMNAFAVLSASAAQRGVERYRRGALSDALADLQLALDTARGQPWETMVDDGRASLMRVQAETGKLDEADRGLHRWCATGPLPETPFGNRLLIERGRLRLAQGRFEEAATDLGAASVRLGGCRDSVSFEWRGAAALAHQRMGDQPAALELAHDDLAVAAAWGAPRQLGIATGTLGLIEGGTGGIDRMLNAIDILTGCSAELEAGRAKVNLGITLRRAGKPRQARPHLRDGHAIALRCGAVVLATTAERELAASGLTRRRRRLLSGPEALTPSEQRVAQLAAEGYSNPDIAGALFVTRKTVEMHLGNAYRKLQISSRQQLRSALCARCA
jgi:DNA-binding CsgD family transcriptional regulator